MNVFSKVETDQPARVRQQPIYTTYMWNMERIGFTASEEKSFENVDDRQRTDYKLTYEPSDHVS